LNSASRNFQKRLKQFSRRFQEGFKEISRIFHRNIKGVKEAWVVGLAENKANSAPLELELRLGFAI